MRTFAIYFLLFTCFVSYGQTDFEGSTVILAKESEAVITYHQYDPVFIARPNISSYENVQLAYPEQFFQAFISARSQAWIDSLTYESKSYERRPEFFLDTKRLDVINNYYELKQKLIIDFEGVRYAVVRFNLKSYLMPESMTGVYVLRFSDGKWKYMENPKFGDLKDVFRTFKIEYFGDLLEGNSQDQRVNNLIIEVTKNNQIDWLQLNNKISLWGFERGEEKDYFLRY